MPDLDITVLILSEHEAFRRDMDALQGREGEELEQAWTGLAAALEVHAAGEEALFYPALLHDVEGSEDETEHAVHDHNEIREATGAVEAEQLGSEAWWEAFATFRQVTADHLGEEEREVLPAFHDQVGADERSELGVRWLQFHEEHEQAEGLSGEQTDPAAFVADHS